MDKLLDSIMVFLVRNQQMDDEQSEIVRYGLELTILKILFFVSVMAIGALMHRVLECCIFFLFFSTLRSYSGGYHAKTRIRCFVQSMLTFALVLAVLKFAEIIPYASIVIAAFAIIFALILWFVSPIDCENKQLEANGVVLFKKKARGCLCIEIVIAIVTWAIGFYGISRAVMLAHIAVGILAVMGIALKNEYGEANER